MPELSKNIYHIPLLADAEVSMVVFNSPAHTGPFKGAIDIAVPLATPVLAPYEGTIIAVVDEHEEYGDSIKYADKANLIQIQHPAGEFSELMHIGKNSTLVRPGETVSGGQKIAETGLSGWMTEPHLHWLVLRKLQQKPYFLGLAIQLDETSRDIISAANKI